MGTKERRYAGYVVATLLFMGIAWIGIAVGMRAGIGIIASNGCTAQIIGDPTPCQLAVMELNRYLRYALGVGIVALILGGIGGYYLQNEG